MDACGNMVQNSDVYALILMPFELRAVTQFKFNPDKIFTPDN